MPRTSLGKKTGGKKTCLLMLFSIGHRRLAARAEDVGGIFTPSHDVIPVPSETPFVNALMRRGGDILPVFDLAARLQVQLQGGSPLCLIAKHRAGPMAVCIDAEMPSLHAVEEASIKSAQDANEETLGTWLMGTEEVPIYALSNLGRSSDQGEEA